MTVDQQNTSHRTTFFIIAMMIASILIIGQIVLTYTIPQEMFNFYSSIGFYKLIGLETCSQCDNKNADYLVGNIEKFDFEQDRCKEGYVEFWVSNWHFECELHDRALERCYDKYPVEYFIEDGDLYQRTVYISEGSQSTICATKLMEGYPANFEQWLEEQHKLKGGLD